MLHHGTDYSRSAFRSKRKLLTVETILKRIHLLFNDISDLTQPTHEQPCGFYYGRSDVAIGMTVHERTNLLLQPLPSGRVRRKDVVHAFNRQQFFCFGRRQCFFSTHRSEEHTSELQSQSNLV